MLKRLFILFGKKKKQVDDGRRVSIALIDPGQTCYEYVMDTGEIREAEVYHYYGKKYILYSNKDCLYECANNKSNAVKKLTEKIKKLRCA